MFFRPLFLLVLIFMFPGTPYGQTQSNAYISGHLSIDSTWDATVYLSHIPNFENRYVMSHEMILAKTVIDSLGYFKFKLDFLPKAENLYRLHLIKKGDTPATLIIGGKDENHLFLIANCFSKIHLKSHSSSPPLKYVTFNNSEENVAFQQITQRVFKTDSLASESSAAKRALLEKQLRQDLRVIADTSNNFLLSLSAIYNTDFESDYADYKDFYRNYLEKWGHLDNAYFKSFVKQLPLKDSTYPSISWVISLLALIFILILSLVFLSPYRLKKARNLDKLSIQERKIYKLLKEGASNQEISDHFNIGLSTVKSHVSRIYSKLNVNSRKDIINLK